ncbi:Ig-like domain-containing protein [Chloroflexi bacterium TSY]|nr:Ig-like domain-containing protein [Chloroflexi bacterium TSY]
MADHRSASGLRAATVKVEDLYDEFNHGVFAPQAIRDFLAYAYHNWVAPTPTYVLLLGGTSYDYRGLLNLRKDNYVPTQVIETDLLGQTPSDNWFVTVSGDDILPDMLIGRLTAQNIGQAEDIVAKIIFYEQSPPDPTWNSNVLLVADDDELSFRSISEQLIEQLPFYYKPNRVYVGDYPPGDPTTDIINAINNGAVMVNYTGHGNVDNWAIWNGGRTFDRKNVTTLDNIGKLPVVTVANCLNGYFAGKSRSTAEEFLRLKDKGAVAVWAPTSLGYPAGHRLLINAFYADIFQNDQYTLGQSTTFAKLSVYAQSSFWGDLVETFVLFGDPATKIGIPTNYPYVKSTRPSDGASDVPYDQEIEIMFSKPMNPDTVLLDVSGGLEITASWNIDNTIVRYEHSGLDAGATMLLTVEGYDRIDTPLGTGLVPSPWSFTVTGDRTAPRATIRVDDGTATDVKLDSSIIISFTEPMRTNSVAYTIVPDIAGELSWDDEGRKATFSHTSPYLAAQDYTVTVSAGQDIAGNALATPLELTFVTKEQTKSVYLPVMLK